VSFNARTKVFGGIPRSPKWDRVRDAFVKEKIFCAGCGQANPKLLAVHHITPYWMDPKLELETSNLICLCTGPAKCHFVLGHLLSWNSFNKNVINDAAAYYKKVANRPKHINTTQGRGINR
jgi:hypothetical protein